MNAPRGAATAATAAKKAAKTAKLAAAASTLGLGLVALVGAAATLLPRHLLDACNWTRHPDVRRAFSTDECYRLLDAAVQAAPKAARRDAADVLFHLVESTRREGALWLGLGLGSLYALAVPFDQRHSALFVLAASGSPAARNRAARRRRGPPVGGRAGRSRPSSTRATQGSSASARRRCSRTGGGRAPGSSAPTGSSRCRASGRDASARGPRPGPRTSSWAGPTPCCGRPAAGVT